MAVKKTAAPPADKGILQSKRFWVLIIGIVTMIVTEVNPIAGAELQNAQGEIAAMITALLFGYSGQDIIKSHHEGKMMREGQNGGAGG